MTVKLSRKLQAIIDSAKTKDEFWIDSAKLDFAITLECLRKQAGKSYRDVALSMGTSPAYISKVFRGDANLTIDTMVKLARSIGGQLEIKVVCKNKQRLIKPERFRFEVEPTKHLIYPGIRETFKADHKASQEGTFAYWQDSSNDHTYQDAA